MMYYDCVDLSCLNKITNQHSHNTSSLILLKICIINEFVGKKPFWFVLGSSFCSQYDSLNFD